MLFYGKEYNIDLQIKNDLSYILSELNINNLKKSNLIESLKLLCSAIETIGNSNNLNEIYKVLNDLKLSLDKIHYNIEHLEKLLELLETLEASETKDESILQAYNKLYCITKQEISQNNTYIENFSIKFTEFCSSFCNDVLNNYKKSDNDTKDQSENASPSINQIEATDERDNNTLLISETKGKVFLPYKIADIQEFLKGHPVYKTEQEVIDNLYIVPLELYKNPIISRFKEAFNLVRAEKNHSLKQAFDLGFELMFRYDLNPAIITACKNIDELDIYLACLDSNELQNFSLFNIVYDFAPTISRHSYPKSQSFDF